MDDIRMTFVLGKVNRPSTRASAKISRDEERYAFDFSSAL
jgi:hypothetical protein